MARTTIKEIEERMAQQDTIIMETAKQVSIMVSLMEKMSENMALTTTASTTKKTANRATKKTSTTKGHGNISEGKTSETVVFIKNDGTKKVVSAAQAEAWENYRNGKKSVDELKALKPIITKAGKDYVKSHPSCTREEAAKNGCKNITKEGLKALKRELGVR